MIAFRGLDAVLACASPSIINLIGGFDELSDVMVEIINGSRGIALQYIATADREVAEFFLVGYSEKLKRMTGNHFYSKPGSLEIETVLDAPSMYAPGLGAEETQK